ncbi:MAG TPA: hypothetical protein VJC10_00460 [Patescibacteria group bacterium]|nr:hypothetical protein [Patescibacteria group bacterium]
MDLGTLQSIQQNFLEELQKAAKGKKTSLPFIEHQLAPTPIVKNDEVFAVLVIGGSIFKKAIVKRKNNTLEFLKKKQKQQPPFYKKEDLLKFIESELEEDISVLAINFAYPLSPVFENGKLDGKLVSGSKENTFSGLQGEKVGEEIEKYIFEKRGKKVIVSVANDTICLLLSGLTSYPWNNLAGGIVGTGINFAIFLSEQRLVNLESASFDKFPQSEEGKEIDGVSTQPGRALFEKETAGAYLFRHFNAIIAKQHLHLTQIASTYELKMIAIKNTPPASTIAKKLIERSAALIACQIGGITKFQDKDMVFVMEGSFFWEEHIYKKLVETYLEKLIPQYNIKFVKVEDSTIFGAAKLVA